MYFPGSSGGANGGGSPNLQNISNDVQHFSKNGNFASIYVSMVCMYVYM